MFQTSSMAALRKDANFEKMAAEADRIAREMARESRGVSTAPPLAPLTLQGAYNLKARPPLKGRRPDARYCALPPSFPFRAPPLLLRHIRTHIVGHAAPLAHGPLWGTPPAPPPPSPPPPRTQLCTQAFTLFPFSFFILIFLYICTPLTQPPYPFPPPD
jgi:hypothetical protein